MNDLTATHDADQAEPAVGQPRDRDDCGDLWAAWDDIGGEG
jgi:hypothetical protein